MEPRLEGPVIRHHNAADWAGVQMSLRLEMALAAVFLSIGAAIRLGIIQFATSAADERSSLRPTFAILFVAHLGLLLLAGVVILVVMRRFSFAPSDMIRGRARKAFVGFLATAMGIIVASGVAIWRTGALDAPLMVRVPHVAAGYVFHDTPLLFAAVLAIGVGALLTFAFWLGAHSAIGVAVDDAGVTRAASFFLIGAPILFGFSRFISLGTFSDQSLAASAVRGAISLCIDWILVAWYLVLCWRCSSAIARSRR